MRQVLVDSGFALTWDRIDGQVRHVVFSLAESTQLHEKEKVRARAATHASLGPFFRPTTVAVVGAGRRRGGIGAEIFHNLVATGATSDPTFGPVIACGTGGTLVELFSDVVLRLNPLTDIDATEMINELRGAPLLRGYRGALAADEHALCDVLVRVSALIDACPEILELEINPLKVLATGACAIDARIRVGPLTARPSRRVIY
jgi:acyl-CoA synthetase (NDP forming)